METPSFITIREAAELAGKNKKTIEVAYKKYIRELGKEIQDMPEIIQTSMKGKTLIYLISEEFVRNHIMKEGGNASTSKRKSSRINSDQDAWLNQIDVKDTQIAEKDKTISELTAALNLAQGNLQNEQMLHRLSIEKTTPRPLIALGKRKRAEPGQDANISGQHRGTDDDFVGSHNLLARMFRMTPHYWLLILLPAFVWAGYQFFRLGTWFFTLS